MRNLLIITFFLASFSVSGKAGTSSYTGKKKQQQDRNEQQQQQDQQRKNEKNKSAESNASARSVPNGLKRVKEIKTAYITKKLDLTPEQSAKFWPLYNQYQEEMFAVQKQIRLNNSPLSTNGKDQIMNEIALDEKKTNIRKHYSIEFLKILPSEKVSLMYKSEREFQDEIIRSMRERKGNADN